MNNLYIVSHGRLQQKERTLCLESEEETHHYPIEGLNDIYVFAEVDFNKRLFTLLHKHSIALHLFTRHRYIGSYHPGNHTTGVNTLRQARIYDDAPSRLRIAKSFVGSAMANMRRNIRYHGKQNPDRKLFESAEAALKHHRKNIQNIQTLPHLLAEEGRAKQIYLSLFDVILKGTGFRFEKRSKHPPENALNALMSLLNALLYNVAAKAIHEADLNIEIAYLHSTNHRSKSLHFDIAEIFKPILVDRLLIRLIKLRIIRHEHFERDGITLTREGLVIVLKQFDDQIRKTLKRHRRPQSYLSLIKRDVHTLKKHLKNPETPLDFFEKRDD